MVSMVSFCVGLVKKWHYYCTSCSMVSILNEIWLLLYKCFDGVNRGCQLCVGLVKTWHYYCTKVQWCQSWMKYHYYGTTAWMVSIVDVIMCGIGEKMTLLLYKSTMVSILNEISLLRYKCFDGVNRGCQLCVGLVKTWHYYCINGTMVSILNELSLLLYKCFDGVNRGCQLCVGFVK
jgi:hypothetical protein